MSGQYKENWKRLTGQIPPTTAATDAGDLTRVSDVVAPSGGGGGGGPYSIVASAVVANGVNAGTVFTATPGRSYVLFVLIPFAPGDNFSSGDEDLVTLGGVLGSNAVQGNTITGTIVSQAGAAEFVATIVPLIIVVSVFDGDETTPDEMRLTFNGDGTINAQHVNNGVGTNGIYIIYERT